jgi:NADH-quinone oxidoreductase subunit M
MHEMVLSAIWLPIFFGLVVLMFGRQKPGGALDGADRLAAQLRGHAAADHRLRHRTAAHAVRRERAWIERFNINYHLGVDGISMWFVC